MKATLGSPSGRAESLHIAYWHKKVERIGTDTLHSLFYTLVTSSISQPG